MLRVPFFGVNWTDLEAFGDSQNVPNWNYTFKLLINKLMTQKVIISLTIPNVITFPK